MKLSENSAGFPNEVYNFFTTILIIIIHSVSFGLPRAKVATGGGNPQVFTGS